MLTTVLFLCLYLKSAVAKHEEPFCLSRFDYDYKVMQKLFDLEQEQKEVRKLMELRIGQQSKLAEQQEIFDEKFSKFQKDIFATLENKLKATSPGSGSIYIHWGRTDCPGNGTETMYSGQVGGSLYSDSGAAANYLCLPSDPLWGEYNDNNFNAAPVYGAEYEGSNNLKIAFKGLFNHEVPCAVCRTPRASVVMIPGRNACYGGWTAEYTGYLAAGHRVHKAATEFVCLDEMAQPIIGSSANKNGVLFYIAEAACGSLKCPPYVAGRELTCAVCSK